MSCNAYPKGQEENPPGPFFLSSSQLGYGRGVAPEEVFSTEKRRGLAFWDFLARLLVSPVPSPLGTMPG